MENWTKIADFGHFLASHSALNLGSPNKILGISQNLRFGGYHSSLNILSLSLLQLIYGLPAILRWRTANPVENGAGSQRMLPKRKPQPTFEKKPSGYLKPDG